MRERSAQEAYATITTFAERLPHRADRLAIQARLADALAHHSRVAAAIALSPAIIDKTLRGAADLYAQAAAAGFPADHPVMRRTAWLVELVESFDSEQVP